MPRLRGVPKRVDPSLKRLRRGMPRLYLKSDFLLRCSTIGRLLLILGLLRIVGDVSSAVQNLHI